ncbi:hypothetical protein [Hymenobacter piscis]|nr:hypothetical protein [Hymenobacter piscis]
MNYLIPFLAAGLVTQQVHAQTSAPAPYHVALGLLGSYRTR